MFRQRVVKAQGAIALQPGEEPGRDAPDGVISAWNASAKAVISKKSNSSVRNLVRQYPGEKIVSYVTKWNQNMSVPRRFLLCHQSTPMWECVPLDEVSCKVVLCHPAIMSNVIFDITQKISTKPANWMSDVAGSNGGHLIFVQSELSSYRLPGL